MPPQPKTLSLINRQRPVVVIVGRVNVGKSTLFNKLAENTKALVSPIPGATRDVKRGQVVWRQVSFTLVDTGGLNPLTLHQNHLTKNNNSLNSQITKLAKQEIEIADLIIFLTDAKSGPTPADKQIAVWLRKTQKKILLVVNKVDSPKQYNELQEFTELGFNLPLAVSAVSGAGVGDLLDAILDKLSTLTALKNQQSDKRRATPAPAVFSPTAPASPLAPVKTSLPLIKVAIIGKPNVGKSTLLNKLIGRQQVLVSAAPFTTREPQEAIFSYSNYLVQIIDTVGLRRKAKIDSSIEKIGVKMSLNVLHQADIALLILDGTNYLTKQDLQLGRFLLKAQTGVIIIINKWDLVKLAVQGSGYTVNPVRTGARSARDFADGGIKPPSAIPSIPPTRVGGVSNGVKTHKLTHQSSPKVKSYQSQVSTITQETNFLQFIKSKVESQQNNLTCFYINYIYQNLPHLHWAPIIFVSALTGLNIKKIPRTILQVKAMRDKRLSPQEQQSLRQSLIRQLGLPKLGPKKRAAQLLEIQQIGISPPSFELIYQSRQPLPSVYLHKLEKIIRKKHKFTGTPLVLKTKQ